MTSAAMQEGDDASKGSLRQRKGGKPKPVSSRLKASPGPPSLQLSNEASDLQESNSTDTMPDHERTLLPQWPKPFPGYKGLFTYRVAASERSADQKLGNGVYLWALEILPGSFLLRERRDSAPTLRIQCRMKKTLLDLPEDACSQMKACLNCYVIEDWFGEAHAEDKVFRLDSIGASSVASTIDFEVDGLPLSRQVLAGEYEMLLAADNSVIRAVHASWVRFAKLNPDEATGIMFRVDSGNSVCPMLRPRDDTLVGKLRKATDLLTGATVYQRGDPRKVYYHPVACSVQEINSVSGHFQAMVVLSLEFLMTRDDVFEYIIHPDGWRPEWLPNIFEVINARDTNAVTHWVESARLKVHNERGKRCIHAHIVITYHGVFAEKYEMEAFPFDVQPLHIKLRAVQETDVTMVLIRDQSKHLMESLRLNWMISEWKLLDICCLDVQQELIDREPSLKMKTTMMNFSSGTETRMHVVCTVQRHARSYLIRIVGVLLLINMLSICIFVIPLDEFQDRIGHSFMMLLTLTTYSLVVGDILPALGYLTFLDKVILVCFGFLAMVVLQITFIGFLNKNKDELDLDPTWWNSCFAYGDFGLMILKALSYWCYVSRVVLPRELRKQPEDPSKDLVDSDDFGPFLTGTASQMF